jgi:hypothetical protein
MQQLLESEPLHERGAGMCGSTARLTRRAPSAWNAWAPPPRARPHSSAASTRPVATPRQLVRTRRPERVDEQARRCEVADHLTLGILARPLDVGDELSRNVSVDLDDEPDPPLVSVARELFLLPLGEPLPFGKRKWAGSNSK